MAEVDKKVTKKPAKTSEGFTAEERAAIRARVKEQKAGESEGEREVLDKIAAMQPSDRAMAERLHAIIKATAPDLTSRTWYGQPAYAKGTRIICFFQPAEKFKTRYATLGFNDSANLDDGSMWPTAFALKELTAAEEARISALVKKAVK
jgi:uncharacterized protein YdhG (YjbR/CyaY superfamily)